MLIIILTDNYYRLGNPIKINLSERDIVLLRQDSPLNMNYIKTTYMLERIHQKTLGVNNLSEVRNNPEKIFVTEFPDLMPETLITREPEEVSIFHCKFGNIILKHFYNNSVFSISQNIIAIFHHYWQCLDKCFVNLSLFNFSDVRAGDKRIILVDGKP